MSRRLPVYALLGANAVSQTGNVITGLAVPWFVLETTGSPARTGITLFATTLPMVVAGFFGGALVDRVGHRRMSVLSDIASGVTVAAIPLLHTTVGLSFVTLLILVFLGTLLDAPGMTARKAMLPDLAAMAGMPLERANAAYQAIMRGSRLVGAPLAGLLIATLGASAALWIDAVTFAVSAAIVALCVPTLHLVAEMVDPYFRQIADGVRFVRRNRLIRVLVLWVAVTNAIDAPLLVVFPVLADERYGSAAALGLIWAANGAGSLVGTFIYGAFGHRHSRRRTFIFCFIAAAAGLWVLVLLPPLPVTLLALVCGGMAAAPLNPVLDTVFQERVPAHLRGRVFGTISAIAWVAMPLGMLAGGFLLDRLGLRLTISMIAACYVVATVSMLFSRTLHEMDRPGEQVVEGEPLTRKL
jgi:MFS family permease